MFKKDNKKTIDRKAFFSEWLERLQQESWHLELLISGFAIFGLFELKDHVDLMIFNVTNLNGNITNICSLFLLIGIYSGVHLFIINLIFHILIRSIWIGALGLRYVSGDIDYKELNYHPRFTEYFKRKIGGFDDYIEKLERLASVMFSYTFLLFFMFLSFVIFFSEFILILSVLANLFGTVDESAGGFNFNFDNNFAGGAVGVFLFVMVFCGFMVLIDFLFLGFFKKIKQKHFSWIYLKIYRLISFITLSFLWRPILLNFLDERYTRKFMILSLPYILLLVVILPETRAYDNKFYPLLEINNTNDIKSSIIHQSSFQSQYYDDLRKNLTSRYDRKLGFVSIPSKYVETNVFEFFIKAQQNDGVILKQMDSTLTPIKVTGLKNNLFSDYNYISEEETILKEERDTEIAVEKKRQKEEKIYNSKEFREWRSNKIKEYNIKIGKIYETKVNSILSLLKDCFSVAIDNVPVPKNAITIDYYKHENGGELGVLCFFNIDSLSYGRHHLNVKRLVVKKNERIDTLEQTIPFIYRK